MSGSTFRAVYYWHRSTKAWWLAFVGCMFAVSIMTRDAAAKETVITDSAYKDACGPFSCLVALRLLGVDASLETVGEKCRWSEGEPVDLASMRQALNTYPGIDCRAAKLTPDELIDLAEDDQTVVILVVRKNSGELNHSVCVASADRSSQSVRWIDYPEFEQDKNLAGIAEVWDGAALIVGLSPAHSIAKRFMYLIIPSLVLLYLIRISIARRDRA